MSNDKLKELLDWVGENTFDTTENDDVGVITSESVDAEYLMDKIQSLIDQSDEEIVRLKKENNDG